MALTCGICIFRCEVFTFADKRYVKADEWTRFLRSRSSRRIRWSRYDEVVISSFAAQLYCVTKLSLMASNDKTLRYAMITR